MNFESMDFLAEQAMPMLYVSNGGAVKMLTAGGYGSSLSGC